MGRPLATLARFEACSCCLGARARRVHLRSRRSSHASPLRMCHHGEGRSQTFPSISALKRGTERGSMVAQLRGFYSTAPESVQWRRRTSATRSRENSSGVYVRVRGTPHCVVRAAQCRVGAGGPNVHHESISSRVCIYSLHLHVHVCDDRRDRYTILRIRSYTRYGRTQT